LSPTRIARGSPRAHDRYQHPSQFGHSTTSQCICLNARCDSGRGDSEVARHCGRARSLNWLFLAPTDRPTRTHSRHGLPATQST
jgi:hypothetical protein